METPIPSALQFTHQQHYVKLTPGSVKKITIIQASPRVDQDLIDPIHNGISVFRTDLLGKTRKPNHVAEHDRNRFPFAFDFMFLSKDFLCQPLRQVALNFFKLFVKGDFLQRGLKGLCQTEAALTTELITGHILGLATGTNY
ncbi:MAG: hypothetical protein R6U28_09325 [Cyclonatronaceae bacterium]